MASSSSSRLPNYQVFLSFRGEDTRHSFTSHLLKALEESGIEVFFDDKELEKGEEISPALLKAIAASKISIVILSKDYASSRSCLTELSQIIDCKRTKEQIVLPIFYLVNPSDVRKHRGSFRTSFDEHLINKAGEIERWKLAFTEVGTLKGWHIQGCSSDRSEPAYIKEIVEVVIQKLNSKFPSGFKDQLVGIDDQKKEVISLLCIPQETTRRVGICGMGGIGKTTLAQAVYDEVSVQFDYHRFLQNVREKLDKQGMESLRNELISKVLKEDIQIDTPSIGSPLIRQRLGAKRVLIVLDDVNDYDQIESLGVEHFGHGSKIIFTSRDKQALKNGVDVIYEVESLNYEYSLRLFSRSAFQQDQPVADFRDLSYIFAKYAGGVPLALKVLGRALYQKPREYWESTRDKLQKYPDQKIFNSLKISIDGLNKLERDIFLDIAFFFNGKDKEVVKKILDSCYKGALYGRSNLVDKFLIDENLRMHDLLQETGWEIARQESDDPEKHSLLRSIDAYHVLKNNKGTESIRGISLNLSEIGVLQLCPSIFDKMVNLRFIKFFYPPFFGNQNPKEFKLLLSDQDPNSLPHGLRYLHWECCPLKSFPSNISNLVELKLTHCNIEQLWNGDQNVVNLRVVDLEGCENLTRIQNLSQTINIRKLCIVSCERLAELPCLDHLAYLSVLFIQHCPIIKFPELPRNLEQLRLIDTQIAFVPSSIGCLNKLYSLILSGPRIQNLPTSIEKLDALHDMDISCCPKITNFPSVPEGIEELRLSGTAIEEVPSTISRLKDLVVLEMEDCNSLKSISDLPTCEMLVLDGCTSLKQVTISNQYQYEFWEGQHWDYSFSNCFNLNPGAIDNIVAHTLLVSRGMAKRFVKKLAEKGKGIHNSEAVVSWLPGNEIPKWFENQSTNSSIIAKLGSIRCGYRGRFLGFVLCLVVNLEYAYEEADVWCMYRLKTKYGDYLDCESNISLFMGDDMSIPLEDPNRVLILFGKGMLQEDKQYEEASFEFCFTDHHTQDALDDIKVEKCGVHVFYVDAKSSDDCNVRPNKRFRSVEDGVELAPERSRPSGGSHLSLIQDDGNCCDPDMMQPHSPVVPNRNKKKGRSISRKFMLILKISREIKKKDLKRKKKKEDLKRNFSSLALDDKDEPERKRLKLSRSRLV